MIKLIENWPVKVLSIALALFLFVFHRLNTMTARPLSVPLTIETNFTLVPASEYPHNVRVTLRGQDDSIKSINDGDIEAYVDLSRHEKEGIYNAPVQIRKKGIALGIEPLEIAVYPLKVTIQLDRRISKNLPVTALTRGRVADGFDLISHSVFPMEVLISGPLTALETVSEIKTEPVDLEGRNSSFTAEINISNPNPLFEIRGSGIAEFSGVIHPTVSVRSVDGIPITVVRLNPAFEADTGGRTGSVRFGGDQTQLDAFRLPASFLTVDCLSVFEPGTYILPITVNLPSNFSLLRREPEEVTLTVSLKEDPL